MRPKTYELSDDDLNLIMYCVEDVADRTVPEARTPYMQTMDRLRKMQPVLPSAVEAPPQSELPVGSSGTGSS